MKTLGKKLMLAALLAGAALPAWSAAFTTGNLVVEQVGDGTQSLTVNGAPIVLNEFTTAGTPVQSIAIPSTGASALVDMGTNATEGMATLSGNGQFLVLAGYNTNAGVTVLTNGSTAVPRAVGYVNASGVFSLGPVSLTNYNSAEIFSAAADGYGNFWAVGSPFSSGYGGICYLGDGTPSAISGTSTAHVIKDIGGNLYYSVFPVTSTAIGLEEVSGVPVNTVGYSARYILNMYTKFRPTFANPEGFVFNPAGTVAYVAETHKYTNSTTMGGVEKWTNNPTTGVFGYAYTLAYGTNGAVGLEADFSQANPVIYGTSANGNSLFSIVDTGVGGNSTGTLLATAAVNTAFRSVSFAPTNGPTVPAVTILTPASTNVAIYGNVSFNSYIYATSGPVNCAWYFATAAATNLIAGATNADLTLTNLSLANSGNYQLTVTDVSGNNVTSSPVSLTVYIVPPGVTNPYSQTEIVGSQASFTPTVGGSGSSAFTYQWYFAPVSTNANITTNLIVLNYYSKYFASVTATNLVPWGTTSTLRLTNVTALNEGNYFVVVSDAWGLNATSAPQALIVTGDPSIQFQPNNAQGVVAGPVQFNVYGVGTPPLSYQWYFSDPSGNLVAPATSLGDGSVLSATNTSGWASFADVQAGTAFADVLTFSNLQPNSITNFVLVVSSPYGVVTSSVCSMLTGDGTTIPSTQGVLALWDFDGEEYTNSSSAGYSVAVNPVPFIGGGTAALVGGVQEYSVDSDPDDQGEDPVGGEWVFTPYGFEQPSPNLSWGTYQYPYYNSHGIGGYYGTNKTAGVQFNISTVGARNLQINYEARADYDASEYFRLQYTTNGLTWIDYPASISFDGQYTSAYSGGFFPFSYDLTGFPGVDNNPNFGFRIVAEFESTATYGAIPNDLLVGNAGPYEAFGSAADQTVSYDIVGVQGDAITNGFTPPVLGGFVNTNMIVTNTMTMNFTATDPWMTASNLTFTVQYVDSVSPFGPLTADWGQNGIVTQTGPTNFQLQISIPGGSIPDPVDATPVVITATDTNGESAVAWFDLTISPVPISYLAFVGAPTITSSTARAITNLTFVAENIGGGNVYLLGSTNLAAPLSQWTPVGRIGLSWTNTTGSIMYTTNTVNFNSASRPQQYFILSTTNQTGQ